MRIAETRGFILDFFKGLGPDDHDAHFNALRQKLEAIHGFALPQSPMRAEFRHEAETIFKAPLGKEVASFLGFIADLAASEKFEALAGDKGKMKPSDPCQYHLELKDLNHIAPSFEGLSFMETRQSRSFFSILASQQAQSPCPTANYVRQRYNAKTELVRSPYGDVSLISFALRFFGARPAEKGRSLSADSSDPAAFYDEACRCFGDPAELGAGVCFFEADNAEILIRPLADIGVSLSVFDLCKPSPVSDKLLKLLNGGMATFST